MHEISKRRPSRATSTRTHGMRTSFRAGPRILVHICSKRQGHSVSMENTANIITNFMMNDADFVLGETGKQRMKLRLVANVNVENSTPQQ